MTKNKLENPITLRVPLPLRRVLEDHLAEHDLVRSRFVRAAITEKLMRERSALRRKPEPPSPFPTEKGP